MFSTNQLEYIKVLLPTYAAKGYKYYVIYSHTMVSSGYYTSTDPDLYAIFSKKAISAQNAYSYDIQDHAVLVTVRSGNYSSSSSAVNTDRVTTSYWNGTRNGNLSIDVYEHVYTNAEFTTFALQPDYNLISGGETNAKIEACGYAVTIALLFSVIMRIFKH